MNSLRWVSLWLVLCLLLPLGAAASTLPTPQTAPCTPGAAYNPACDVDHDNDVDIFDIQLTAGHWGQTGTFLADGWGLTGNAGTVPGTNFLGTSDNQAIEIKVNNQRALRIEPTAQTNWINIIGGSVGNTVAAGVYGVTIAGGGGPAAPNQATGNYAAIGGGYNNQAAGAAVVDGGRNNTATVDYATVGGGAFNNATATSSTVAGGYENNASGYRSTVSGGSSNTASGQYAVVPGGDVNTADGDNSFAAGHRAKALGNGTFVWADSTNADFTGSSANQFLVRASAGAYYEGNNTGYVLRAFNLAAGTGLRGATNGTYAGYFEDNIFVTGSCNGCELVYVGVNDGTTPLAPGDVVAPAGLSTALQGSAEPVLRLRRAGDVGTNGVAGVVLGRAELRTNTVEGVVEQIAEQAAGPVAPGDHLFVLVQGLGQVRLDARAATVIPGQRLTLADNGQARPLRTVEVEGVRLDEGGPVLGVVVEPAGADGLAWVLVNLR